SPATVVLLAIKDERVIHVHAGAPGSAPVYIDSIPVVAASGGPGPKLREGDLQVPEGAYPIESLNPNSRFHVSLRIGYPNDFDRAMAERDGRTRDRVPLGGDIMIHGSDVSVGCLAVGDDAAERLFTLAADAGLGNVRVVIVPTDLAAAPAPAPGLPDWVPELYRALDAELARLEPAPEGAP
ncbi:MAG: murein L,D-transpeptidase family protein, partial [Planctomycetota bacterium]